jgi:hypothetical protein
MDGLTEEFDTGNIGRHAYRPTDFRFYRPNDKTDAIRLDTTTGRKRWWSLLGCKDFC